MATSAMHVKAARYHCPAHRGVLAQAFPDSKAVNDALRVLVNAAKGQVRQAAPRGHSATKSIRSTSARQSPTKKARTTKAARGQETRKLVAKN